MKPIVYVCATSNRAVAARVDEHALWMEMDQVAHLFGLKRAQTAKLLRQVRTTGEIDAVSELRGAGGRGLLLSHRAVVALGYHTNYGRATALRAWCASHLPGVFHDATRVRSRKEGK